MVLFYRHYDMCFKALLTEVDPALLFYVNLIFRNKLGTGSCLFGSAYQHGSSLAGVVGQINHAHQSRTCMPQGLPVSRAT